MKCSVLKLTLIDPPDPSITLSDAEDFLAYLFNYYPRETEIVIEDDKNHGIGFFYLKDNVLYCISFRKNNNISESNLILISNNGTCFPSKFFKVEIGKHASLDIYDYTGNSDETDTLLTRLAAFGECNINGDLKTTIGEIDTWISDNSKTYTIDDMEPGVSKIFWSLDSSEHFSNELGQWFQTHINSNLSESYALVDFIENNS